MQWQVYSDQHICSYALVWHIMPLVLCLPYAMALMHTLPYSQRHQHHQLWEAHIECIMECHTASGIMQSSQKTTVIPGMWGSNCFCLARQNRELWIGTAMKYDLSNNWRHGSDHWVGCSASKVISRGAEPTVRLIRWLMEDQGLKGPESLQPHFQIDLS